MSKRRRPQNQETDPTAIARQAMVDVLERAKASRDDDRILAAAKSVLAHATKEPAQTDDDRARGYTLDEMNLEEQQELRDIIRTVKLHQNKVRQRLGREQVSVPAYLFEEVKAPEPPRVLPPQWYPPQPAPRPKVEADATAAPASTPVAVDPLADYIAGEDDEEFNGPVEVLE